MLKVWALQNNARPSGAGKRTAASGVAWSGCASLRGALCAGELAFVEARTHASVRRPFFSNSGPTPLRSDPNLQGLKV